MKRHILYILLQVMPRYISMYASYVKSSGAYNAYHSTAPDFTSSF